MPQEFDSLSDLLNHGFDTVIDVRSPAEYVEDHVPGAVSMPALSNAERAHIGTIYKQVSPFEAKKAGAVLVARNAATAIETQMQDKDGGWRPLVYCWRGGQRSGSFSTILAQIGWRTDTIKGGYQTYRRLVYRAVYEERVPHRVILLDGLTGTAKTDILNRLPNLGIQIVDLEGLANHRGSLIGALEGGQPSQKAFEGAIACALARLDPDRPVVMEAESSKIGRRIIPPTVWEAMCAAPRIEVRSPVPSRVEYLCRAYADAAADTDWLKARFQPIRHHRGHDLVDRWEALLQAGDMPELARSLIVDHYDPSYTKSRAAHDPVVIGTVDVPRLDDAGQDAAARNVAEIVRSL
ncbi:tRNA 2-selenouridine(34) synthase MnmH [Marivivens marinus]|uniref:tRNA 2-selenouridine(34) synthase MnmH n=1 Tax=Marivivens marinus TaxID=3110173 RepID=UPI003B847B48